MLKDLFFCYNRLVIMEEFKVTINDFEGPLDLMLHLIREKEMDLADLDLNILTDQYIAFIAGMDQLHLEVAGEYLVEMAALIEYKSKKLIPGSTDVMEGEYEEDPKEKLVRRLLEYQQFKEVTGDLNEMFVHRQKQMTKSLSAEAEQWMKPDEDVRYHGSPYDLMGAMQRCMMRLRLSRPVETKYTAREISVEDREAEVKLKISRLPLTFRFDELLDDCHDKPMFIATFLAVLDLARQHSIFFTVDENDVIWFSRGDS